VINREWKTVQVLTYSNTTDEYGQKRQDTPIVSPTKMVCKIYSQSENNSMIYKDVEMIGLTKSTDITDKNEILIDGVKYLVLFVIPSSRLTQVLMKKA